MNCAICSAALPADALFCGECGSATSATVTSRRVPDAAETLIVEPVPPAADSTRFVTIDPRTATAIMLRFSTGEAVSITGPGLVGRRPRPEPQERFDHIVHVDDRGLSVSKTHLEFGFEDGRLWIADRFSSNGTMLRRADGSLVRCEPGKRYRVSRGDRVEIAEQSFVVV